MYMNEKLIQEKLEEMNATKIQKLDSPMYLILQERGSIFCRECVHIPWCMASFPMSMKFFPLLSMMLRSFKMLPIVQIL